MSRNYGLDVDPEARFKMYTKAEFDEACWINLVMGAFVGAGFAVLALLGYLWLHGYLL